MSPPEHRYRAELEALAPRHFAHGKLRDKRTYAQAKLPLMRRGAPN